ncbi:formylglycine-generating enzyme family protein [bacterium]|nr:formylglycine-generating enzyme family protein [bacterium]
MFPDMELVFIEGNVISESHCSDHAYTSSPVVESFMMGKFEVNQDQWLWVMYSFNPSQFKGFNQPVENVSWYDAIQFCNSLSHMEAVDPFYNIDGIKITRNLNSSGYRLPTEAEWEYAARGGKWCHSYRYSGSDSAKEVAWYAENSNNMSHNIGQKSPNELGIYDFSGNVWEWCWDGIGNEVTTSLIGIQKDSEKLFRVIRGGGWQCHSDSLGITNYKNFQSSERRSDLGFRICRSIHK